MEVAPGILEINTLAEQGFSEQEIDEYRQSTAKDLYEAGFSDQEVNAYFGTTEPDMSHVEKTIQNNLSKYAEPTALNPGGVGPTDTRPGVLAEGERPPLKEGEPQAPKVAKTFLEALEAGFDMSVSGLVISGKSPDMVLNENPEMFMRIAMNIGTIAGDLPAMIAGGIGGGAAGGAAGAAAGTVALPLVGTVGLGATGAVLGAGAGGNALPEAIRTALMESYEKGDVQSFSDFWERASTVFINSTKAGIVGAATAGVGGKVAGIVGQTAAPTIAKTSAQLLSEVATMTTVGSALNGKVPEPQEFLDAALLVGGLHAAGALPKMSKKIGNLYAKTGQDPATILAKAESNPKLKQEMMAVNVETPPSAFDGAPPPTPKPPETFQTVKPLKATNPDLPPEINTILGKVSETVDAPKKMPTFNEFYTNYVDKLDPINRVTDILSKNIDDLPANENPYIMARTAVDAKAKAKHFFEKGIIDFETQKTTGPSLKSILESVDNPEMLDAFLISKRVIEKEGQGFKTGFDLEAAKTVVEKHSAKYEAAAKQVTDWSNQVMDDYVVKSGLLSPESAARMKELNKNYVPFKRISEIADSGGKTKAGGGKGGSLKEFTGSDKDIQSPILSIVENTIDLLQMAENNKAGVKLIELAEKSGDTEIFTKVKTPVKPVTLSEKQVAAELVKMGLDPAQAEPITVYARSNKELAPNEFAIYRNGKREIFKTDPEIADAMKRLGGDVTSQNFLFKLMRGFTVVKKIAITTTPDFVIKNFIRDNVTASTFSKSGGISPIEVLGAMGDLIKKNDTYYNWLKSGGANGAFIEMGKGYIANDIFALQKQTGFMNSARNVMRKPVELARLAAEISEQSLRLAEFKKVTKGDTSAKALAEGGMASREITIDFQRVGAKMAALNSMTAFLNVSVQGMDRSIRAFKENPAGTAAKAAAYITAPSILLWYANKDDRRVQELPRWQKDLFWIVATDSWEDASTEDMAAPDYMLRQGPNGKTQINKGVIYRIPKPQDIGIMFGSLPERALEAFFGTDPNAFRDFEETVGNLITPNLVPDAVAPAIEQYFNKSFFTGSDIIPHNLQGIMPEYQYVEYTSETAKTIGKLISSVNRETDFASPMVIDNYIRSWGGALGQYSVQIMDRALEKAGVVDEKVRPTATLADIPFVKSFVVRYPQANSRSVQDFYESFEGNKKIQNTLTFLKNQQDLGNLEKEMMAPENQMKLMRLDGIKQGLSAQSQMIRKITKDPDMSPDEKRQMIDSLYLQMTEVASQANDMLRELEKSVKDQPQGEE